MNILFAKLIFKQYFKSLLNFQTVVFITILFLIHTLSVIFSFANNNLRGLSYDKYYTSHQLNPEHYNLKQFVHTKTRIQSIYNYISCDVDTHLNLNTTGSLVYLMCYKCYKIARQQKLNRVDFFECIDCKRNLKTLNTAFFNYEITTYEDIQGVNDFVIMLLSQKISLIAYLFSIIIPAGLMINYFNFVLLNKLKNDSMLEYIFISSYKKQMIYVNLACSLLCSVTIVLFFFIFSTILYKSCLKAAILAISGVTYENSIDLLLKPLEYTETFINLLIVLSLSLSDYVWHFQTNKKNVYVFQIVQIVLGIVLYAMIFESDHFFVCQHETLRSNIKNKASIPLLLRQLCSYEDLQSNLLVQKSKIIKFTQKRRLTSIPILILYILFLINKLQLSTMQSTELLIGHI